MQTFENFIKCYPIYLFTLDLVRTFCLFFHVKLQEQIKVNYQTEEKKNGGKKTK